MYYIQNPCYDQFIFIHTALWFAATDQQTRVIDPMCEECWDSVVDADPALFTHWVNMVNGSCLLGELREIAQ